MFPQKFQGTLAVLGVGDRVAVSHEPSGEQRAVGLVVVGDQDGGSGRRRSARARRRPAMEKGVAAGLRLGLAVNPVRGLEAREVVLGFAKVNQKQWRTIGQAAGGRGYARKVIQKRLTRQSTALLIQIADRAGCTAGVIDELGAKSFDRCWMVSEIFRFKSGVEFLKQRPGARGEGGEGGLQVRVAQIARLFAEDLGEADDFPERIAEIVPRPCHAG